MRTLLSQRCEIRPFDNIRRQTGEFKVAVEEGRIEADCVTVEDDVILQPGSIIRGSEVVLRRGALIGRDVEIVCDFLDR